MDNLIDRQAAIDALDVLCQEHRYRIPGKRETYSQYNEAWQDALDRAEGAIFNLPPAQPEKRTGERTETHACDSISRQAAVDAIDEISNEVADGYGFDYAKWREYFCELPPAEPEIIRCRECKFASGDSRICMKFDHSPIGELDFCAWAERRTDE